MGRKNLYKSLSAEGTPSSADVWLTDAAGGVLVGRAYFGRIAGQNAAAEQPWE